MLTYETYGEGPTLIIAHGLFGSARNWRAIAKKLAQKGRQVITVDMRNHGDSPWYDSHSYFDMANDLRDVLEKTGPSDVLGHSMGGKAAMVLALTHPEFVNRLIVADIAPVIYHRTQLSWIEAMRSVDLSQVSRRGDADEQLKTEVDDAALRAFFLQSLELSPDGNRWKLNLDVLERYMPDIMGFPDLNSTFQNDVMFLNGGASDYVRPEHHAQIYELFPKARIEVIEGVGHWLHAEAPTQFIELVEAML